MRFLIKLLFLRIWETIRYHLTPSNKRFLITGYAFVRRDKVMHTNFGDDVNFYLIKALTGKRIFNYKNVYFQGKDENFLCIGSIINACSNSNAVIWGSGLMYGDRLLEQKPKRVVAVRGLKTRQKLMEQGVDCPEVYGDPALLLPIIYKPNFQKKYKFGLIPHYVDEDKETVTKIAQALGDCKIISMANYDDWHSVIDSICECECIVSSSLHGMIISDAYCIPNVWIEFSKDIEGDRFKYYDYFSSVHRTDQKPLYATTETLISDICNAKEKYECILFDHKELLSVAPFEVFPQFLNKS